MKNEIKKMRCISPCQKRTFYYSYSRWSKGWALYVLYYWKNLRVDWMSICSNIVWSCTRSLRLFYFCDCMSLDYKPFQGKCDTMCLYILKNISQLKHRTLGWEIWLDFYFFESSGGTKVLPSCKQSLPRKKTHTHTEKLPKEIWKENYTICQSSQQNLN